jgi:uncharacterized repeat protein (TIGR03803 family)
MTKVVVVLCFVLAIVGARPAQAHSRFKLLHSFDGKDGGFPQAGLVQDSAGNLYGTASEGGSYSCGSVNCGTAFKMDKNGKILWVHSFDGPDGQWPAGLVLDSSGDLYGIATYGGNTACDQGCGVVFELNKDGRETVLHKFDGADGSFPAGTLIEDQAGNLYGTTAISFGSTNGGTVFELSKTGKITILYTFSLDCGSDGCDPAEGVILDAAGNIYGTTQEGGDPDCGWHGSGCGVVFEISNQNGTWTETVLHTFGGPDGADPIAPLLMDSAGNLYGTTVTGGNANCPDEMSQYGCGVVFELSLGSGGTWTENVLHIFCDSGIPPCADGNQPEGSLVRDASGNLFGTTTSGGNSGAGVAFKLDTSGNETILYNFSESGGYAPVAGVASCGRGSLCGTALGGTYNDGTVFKVIP